MAEIHLVVPKGARAEEVQTAWFDLESAQQQCEATNKEIEGLYSDNHTPDDIEMHEVVTVAIQDANVLPYIAVYSEGGIIQKAVPGVYLEQLIKDMDEELYDNFDHETDDARIFDAQGNQVHSFDHEAMYAKLKANDEASPIDEFLALNEDGEEEDDEDDEDDVEDPFK